MANIYTGNGLKIFYNEDTANRLPQNAGNEQISEIAAMPTLHIAAAMAQVETYDSEYVEQLAGEQNVDPVEITVNYIPGEHTHAFLDEATKTQKEFQLILVRRNSERTFDYSLMNGRISAAALSGDKDSVVQKTYTFTPTEMIVRDANAIASVELYEGSYGVGSNGVNVPQYEPLSPAGNSFIKVPADQVGNPVSVDMMGIGFVDGNTFSSIAVTKSGSLAIYAKNQTTAWTRILTSNLGDSKYVALTGDQTIDGTKTFIKGIYVDSLTVTESITGKSITVNNSTLGTAQADDLTLGQPLSVANGGTGSKNATDARLELGVKEAGTFDIVPIANGGTGSKNATDARLELGVKEAGTFDVVPIANGGTNASTALQARINLGLISKTESDTRYLKTVSNLSDLSDVEEARTNLDVLSTIENDAKYLQTVNNLSDLDNTTIARVNLGVQSTIESDYKYVPKTTTINDHELTGNITLSSSDTGSLAIINNLSDIPDPAIARTNLGVQSTTESDTRYLKTASNLSDLSDVEEARTNLDVLSTSESDSKYLIKSNNLSDISDIAIARTSLNVNRILQDTSYTSMFSSDMKGQLTVRDDGEWGMYYSDPEPSESGWRALGIQQGGTGANDDATARINLKVDSLLQQPTETQLCTPDRTKYMFIQNAGGWGAYDTTSGQRQPLPLASGGTGALDAAGALTNLGIAWENEVRFKRVTINGTPGNNSSGFLCNVPSGGGDSWRDRGTGLAIQGSNVRGGAVSIIKVSIPGQGYIGALEGFLYSNGATELRVSVEGGSIFQFSSDGAGRANNWISLSDQRLKTDILPISNALDKLDKINGYTYRKFINMEAAKNNDVTNISHEAGVLAQEIKEALPEAVSAYGEDSVLGIKAGAIDALLINAVKELNTQVKEQQEQITQLMAMVNAQNITITELMNK
ncbi:TPA: tail fiber domain-containing protein [Citrobacter youngae]|nr:tail fiber domain-containing protein [Citrobacter youngae]